MFVRWQDVLHLLDESQPFGRWMINQLNARLAHYVAMVENFRLSNSTARVAYCLAELFNPVLYPNTPATLLITQEGVARLSGVSRQVANGALKELQLPGLIRVGYGEVEVLDLARLQV